MIEKLPERYVRMIKEAYGEEGEKWLSDLEPRIRTYEKRWSMRVQGPYPLSYNYVAPAVLADGSPVVFKLGLPGGEILSEIEALRIHAGNGMAKLIEADSEAGTMLLEQIRPGHTLETVGSEEVQTRIIAEVIEKIDRLTPAHYPFPTVARWAEGLTKIRRHFRGGTGPLPEGMVQQAEEWYSKLLASTKHLRLLHGDLHHGNVLAAEREPWLAIDPKGVVGEREYEVIPFLLNYVPQEDATDVIKRRVEHLSRHLQLRQDRVLAWAFCHSMLSAWWHIEDHTGGEEAVLQKARIFDRLARGRD